MAAEPVRMRNLDPTQNELASLHQGMKIESLSDSEFHGSVPALGALGAVQWVWGAKVGRIVTATLTSLPATVQNFHLMPAPAFAKSPKVIFSAIVIAWLAYIIYSNFQL